MNATPRERPTPIYPGDSAATLIAYCAENYRVCPIPQRWSALWELLPDRRRTPDGWEPAAPLILTAWHGTTALEKTLRVATHIIWAERHGAMVPVSSFLRGLLEEDWLHLGAAEPRVKVLQP